MFTGMIVNIIIKMSQQWTFYTLSEVHASVVTAYSYTMLRYEEDGKRLYGPHGPRPPPPPAQPFQNVQNAEVRNEFQERSERVLSAILGSLGGGDVIQKPTDRKT